MKLMEKRRGDLVLMLETAAGAAERHFAGRKVYVDGKPRAPGVIVAALRRHVRKHYAVAAMYDNWLSAARKLRAELRTEIVPAMYALRDNAEPLFGKNSVEFRAFGFRPRKRREQSAESRRIAAEKARATRKARGTMGKKQRRATKASIADGDKAGT